MSGARRQGSAQAALHKASVPPQQQGCVIATPKTQRKISTGSGANVVRLLLNRLDIAITAYACKLRLREAACSSAQLKRAQLQHTSSAPSEQISSAMRHPPAGCVAIKQAGVVPAEARVVDQHVHAGIRPAAAQGGSRPRQMARHIRVCQDEAASELHAETPG